MQYHVMLFVSVRGKGKYMKKKSIYYARTYRYLYLRVIKSILFIGLLVVPCLILFIIHIEGITGLLSDFAVKILGENFKGIPLYIVQTEFSALGSINFVDLPTVYPDISFTFINFLAVLLMALFLVSGKRRGKPISIYFMLGLLIHMINCIYFIFAVNYFPYTSFQYSVLYMKQQVGIWITFIVLTGLVVGFIGNKGLFAKILAFFAIMGYSFVFGAVRYVFFLYIIEKFSILYMAIMFFVLGPFFDFLYMVAIYGIFIDHMVKFYDSEKGREEWKWS